ncbi:MAG: hypothetical protein NVS2B12_21880 [Ktedonobacteraceae bacterium]
MYRGCYLHKLASGYLFGLLVVVLLAGCTGNGGSVAQGLATGTAVPAQVNRESTIAFSLTGGQSARYMLRAATPISKLRHGHREFTIDIVDARLSIFIVFYGYDGPGNYTLTKNANGGDVHVSLGDAAPAWDLSLQPTASCDLAIRSDRPTTLAGLDRMQGTLACPLLFSSNPSAPKPSVTLQDGSFDIAMLVES